MKGRIWHKIMMAAFAALLVVSCRREKASLNDDAQLMVSLYVPGATMTRAETGLVNPLSEEMKFTSLRIWAFFSDTGELISYKCFQNSDDTPLNQTGLPNSTITRFGLPLTAEMFDLLTSASPRPSVDVYAVANVESAVADVPGEGTSRAELDQIVINKIGAAWPLTRAVPDAGLPMSGVIKSGIVTGGYPVLNITTLKLTRAVSKIRFVFAQQGIPATENSEAVIANDACKIVSVSFDGTSNGKDCQIPTTERLFTDKAIDLGDDPAYVALSATITGQDGNPIVPNEKLSIVEDPETLFFRSEGNETETAEHYEARLDAAVSTDSQVGPIYFRETDKRISGTIDYRTTPGGELKTAPFSIDASDVFSRNHTWIVYACFVEETMKLEIKVTVLDWDWQSYQFDFTSGSVNVVRRFTVFETHPSTFRKEEANGFYDIRFWHTVDGVGGENVVKGDIIISTPVGAILHVLPIPPQGGITDAILVDTNPSPAIIYPNYAHMENGRIEDCIIGITIKANKDKYSAQQLEGQYIDLHFSVETQDGQFIDLGSESIDYYRFILDSHWMPSQP